MEDDHPPSKIAGIPWNSMQGRAGYSWQNQMKTRWILNFARGFWSYDFGYSWPWLTII